MTRLIPQLPARLNEVENIGIHDQRFESDFAGPAIENKGDQVRELASLVLELSLVHGDMLP
jgi:hypothetical protein